MSLLFRSPNRLFAQRPKFLRPAVVELFQGFPEAQPKSNGRSKKDKNNKRDKDEEKMDFAGDRESVIKDWIEKQ